MEHVNAFKGTLAVIGATLSALWGWFGWLILIWVTLMALDFFTGSRAGVKKKGYDSVVARDGLWKKAGSIIAVAVSALTDSFIRLIIDNLPGIELPFEYSILICPLVVVWYVATETGSILENLVNMGVKLPPFLQGVVKLLKVSADAAGKKFTPGDDT